MGLIAQGAAAYGRQQALAALSALAAIDPDAYAEILKATPYYWLGVAASQLQDYESAVLFFHAGALEDWRHGSRPTTTPTPPMRFMMLDGESQAQAAQLLSKQAQDRVQEIIDYYMPLGNGTLNPTVFSMDDLRRRLLIPALDPDRREWHPLATALISYCLEWDYRNSLFDVFTGGMAVEPFYMHLFKGCLLFESLLKQNPTHVAVRGMQSLRPVLEYLQAHARFPTPTQDIGGGVVLSHVADRVNQIANAPAQSVADIIEVTGKSRNTFGHNLGWNVQLTKWQYHHWVRMIAAACLFAIHRLYPAP